MEKADDNKVILEMPAPNKKDSWGKVVNKRADCHRWLTLEVQWANCQEMDQELQRCSEEEFKWHASTDVLDLNLLECHRLRRCS